MPIWIHYAHLGQPLGKQMIGKCYWPKQGCFEEGLLWTAFLLSSLLCQQQHQQHTNCWPSSSLSVRAEWIIMGVKSLVWMIFHISFQQQPMQSLSIQNIKHFSPRLLYITNCPPGAYKHIDTMAIYNSLGWMHLHGARLKEHCTAHQTLDISRVNSILVLTAIFSKMNTDGQTWDTQLKLSIHCYNGLILLLIA